MNRWANRVSVILTVGLLAAAGGLGWAMKPREAAAPAPAAVAATVAPTVAQRPNPPSARAARPPAPIPLGGTIARRPLQAGSQSGQWLEWVGAAAGSAARVASSALSASSTASRRAWAWTALRAPDALAALAAAATGAAAWVVAPLVMLLALGARSLAARARRTSRSRVLGRARRGGSAASIARRMGIPQDAVRALMRPDPARQRGGA